MLLKYCIKKLFQKIQILLLKMIILIDKKWNRYIIELKRLNK